MLSLRFDRAGMQPGPSGVVLSTPVFSESLVGARLTAGWNVLPPGVAMPPNAHAPAEVYVVMSGRGEVTVGEHSAPVGPLDSVFIAPHLRHQIRPTGPQELAWFALAFPTSTPCQDLPSAGVPLCPFDPARLKAAHQATFYWSPTFSRQQIGAPIDLGWGLVHSGVASELHRHQTAEVYVFVQGQAIMQVGQEALAVAPGDCAFVPAQGLHCVTNVSGADVLLYWYEFIPGTV